MSSDDEKRLFELWSWENDVVKRVWLGPEHWHAGGHCYTADDAPLLSQKEKPCRVAIPYDSLMQFMQDEEAEGKLVGLVMTHGVRRKTVE